jgi:hypothetical protein
MNEQRMNGQGSSSQMWVVIGVVVLVVVVIGAIFLMGGDDDNGDIDDILTPTLVQDETPMIETPTVDSAGGSDDGAGIGSEPEATDEDAGS